MDCSATKTRCHATVILKATAALLAICILSRSAQLLAAKDRSSALRDGVVAGENAQSPIEYGLAVAESLRLVIIPDPENAGGNETRVFCMILNKGARTVRINPAGIAAELWAISARHAEPVTFRGSFPAPGTVAKVELRHGDVYGLHCTIPRPAKEYGHTFTVKFYYIVYAPGMAGRTGNGAVDAVVYPDRIDRASPTTQPAQSP